MACLKKYACQLAKIGKLVIRINTQQGQGGHKMACPSLITIFDWAGVGAGQFKFPSPAKFPLEK
jgi:hypothetical protein